MPCSATHSSISRGCSSACVQRQAFALGVAADLLEPVARAGADGVGGEPDAHACFAQLLELPQVVGGRVLAEAVEPAAAVGGEEQDERDPGLLRGLGGRAGLGQAEVMELAHRRVPGREHLPVGVHVGCANGLRRLRGGKHEHRVAPGPEVAALGAPAQRPLEGVAVRVHEPGQLERLGHLGTDRSSFVPLP